MIAPEPEESPLPTCQLWVGVPGLTTIASDEMLGDIMRLSTIHETLERAERHLSAIAQRSTGAPEEAGAFADLNLVVATIRPIRDAAEKLGTSLTTAIQTYSSAEVENHALLDFGSTLSLGGLGALFGLSPLLSIPGLHQVVGGPLLQKIVEVGLATPSDVRASDMKTHASVDALISNEQLILALRYLIENSDVAIRASGGDQAALLSQLESQGITGVAATAAIAAFYASQVKALQEGPVSVRKTATETNAAPTGYAQNGQAIPNEESSPGGAQMRVDTIHTPGAADKHVIYLGGTGDFSLVPGGNAFDMTSNVNAIAGFPAGAIEGIKEALKKQGISSLDEIQIWGHSQGGLLAAVIAESEQYNVTSLVTLGAPVGNISIPTDINAVLVENLEDLVPATGGIQHNTSATNVLCDAFAPGEALPAGLSFPGHQMATYNKTLIAMDLAESPQITDAAEKIAAFSNGATTVTSNYYRIDRVES